MPSVDLQMRLIEAAKAGDLAEVQASLAAGADPAEDGSLALYEAVRAEQLAVVQHLIPLAPVDSEDHEIGMLALGALSPAIPAAILPHVDRRATLVAFANNPDIRDNCSAFQALKLGGEVMAPYLSPDEMESWATDSVLSKLPSVQAWKRSQERLAYLTTRPPTSDRPRRRA